MYDRIRRAALIAASRTGDKSLAILASARNQRRIDVSNVVVVGDDDPAMILCGCSKGQATVPRSVPRSH